MGEGLVKITSARESEFVLAPVRERESTNKEVNVDRPDVDRKRLLLEWLLSSSLQGLGSKWTEWEVPGTLKPRVDWAYFLYAIQSKRLLE